tara:strand:+ start:448 stop:609 length:162 start_codon:yes stop_codon:yes gene_type:complete
MKNLKLELSRTQRTIKTLLDERKLLKGTEKQNVEYVLAGLCAMELELVQQING